MAQFDDLTAALTAASTAIAKADARVTADHVDLTPAITQADAIKVAAEAILPDPVPVPAPAPPAA